MDDWKINGDSGARPECHCIYIHFACPFPMAITASVLVMRMSGYLFLERLMARGSRRNLRFLTGRARADSSAVCQICEAKLELAAVSIRGSEDLSKRSISLKLKAPGGKIVGNSRLPHHPPHQVVA